MSNVTGNCSLLSGESSFASYIALLRNITSPDLSVAAMTPCRAAICSTLYGVGNADISGIGVITGYILELVLGLMLAAGLLALEPESRWHKSINSAFPVYADNALLLSASIQLAAFVTFFRKLFGLEANGFGDLVMQSTWAAATLTMLPLFLLINIKNELEKRKRRISFIVLTWLLFVFVFVSRMYEYFSNGQIGTSHDSVMTSEQADNIASLCGQATGSLSQSTQVIFDFFSIGGSIFLSLAILASLAWELLDEETREVIRRHYGQQFKGFMRKHSKAAQWLVVVNVAVWAIPQIWALLYFRARQRFLAASLGTQDDDNGWSFGQIVAVVVFLPVFVEFVCTYHQWESKREDSVINQSDGSP